MLTDDFGKLRAAAAAVNERLSITWENTRNLFRSMVSHWETLCSFFAGLLRMSSPVYLSHMKPEEINDRFGEAYNANDLEGLLALYEEDAILDFGYAGRVQGTAAIRAALTPFLALRGTLSYERRFCLVFGELALLSIAYRLTDGRAPDGSPVNNSGVTVELARRQNDGTWKYLVDLPNGATPV